MAEIPSGMSPSQLLNELREVLMKLALDRTNTGLARRAEELEAEIDRRMSW